MLLLSFASGVYADDLPQSALEVIKKEVSTTAEVLQSYQRDINHDQIKDLVCVLADVDYAKRTGKLYLAALAADANGNYHMVQKSQSWLLDGKEYNLFVGDKFILLTALGAKDQLALYKEYYFNLENEQHQFVLYRIKESETEVGPLPQQAKQMYLADVDLVTKLMTGKQVAKAHKVKPFKVELHETPTITLADFSVDSVVQTRDLK